MFEIKFDNKETFTKVINAAAAVLNEANFKFNPDGIILESMDDTHLVLVSLKINNSHFKVDDEINYNCDAEYTVQLDIGDFKKIIQRASKDDIVTIKKQEKSNQLLINFEGKTKKTFLLAFSQPDSEEVGSYNLERDFEVDCTLSGGILSDFMKDAAIVGGEVTIEAREGKLILMSSEADRTKEVKVEISSTGEDDVNNILLNTDKEAVTGTYPYEKLKNCLQMDTLTPVVKLGFTTEEPLKLHYNIGDDIKMIFFIAPITSMEEEENEELDEEEDEEEWDEEEEEEEEEWDSDDEEEEL